MKTTKAIRTITSIADVEALEAMPYDALVPACTLLDLFRATAELHPSRPALTTIAAGGYAGQSVILSHADLYRAILRAANFFHQLGAAAGAKAGGGTVAFLTPILPGMVEALYGAQTSGIASTINYLLNARVIADLLAAEAATTLVIPAEELDGEVWRKANEVIALTPTLRNIVVLGASGDVAAGQLDFQAEQKRCRDDGLDFASTAGRDTVCALFHTGGTTGRPKLVQLTHGNQIHAAWSFAQVHGLDELDVVINGFPLFHVGGTITAGLSVLAAGGHMIVPSPYGLRDRGVIATYWKIVEAFGVTIVGGVPTSIAAITEVPIGDADISSVRMALTGGAVCPRAVSDRFQSRTGIRLYETYGMTETAAAIAFNPGRALPVQGSVGFRAPFARTRITSLDPARQDMPCAPQESGLVQVMGPQVFPGYVDPAHNRGIRSPDGWLITGDVGYLTEDQRLVLTGREKDLIVRSGHNINPSDIEDVANIFPGVQISAAVGMPDAYAGEVPVLFVVPSPGMVIDMEALDRHLGSAIAEPPARPKRVFQIDALPTTAVGKIVKADLRDRAIEEKVKAEIERAFGASVEARIQVGKDDKLNTVVRVEIAAPDDGAIQVLKAALEPLPQRYDIVTGPTDEIAVAEPVLLSRSGHVATITLNRPSAMNALSPEVMDALDRVLDELHADETTRVVIVTGAGRAFCAGGDLLEFGRELELDPSSLLDTLAYNQRVLVKLRSLPMPVLAAVNGVAVAGGLEIILSCDVVIAAEAARIGDGHARYAIVPAAGSTVQLLTRMHGAHAMHMLFSGELFSARQCMEWGLVNEVVPAERLHDRVMEIAGQYSQQSPAVLQHMKSLARTVHDGVIHSGLRAELTAFQAHLTSRDLAEGLRAFREKRQPRY
ncbi:MAG: AMP-binding protein [Ferrovibrio sp.]|uniref:AMP-binding protein n=1 Tax=Ferrovibrio sp. TaxID=1917215 RepID=UPI0026389881|nr:AMP-binding protein [Ferrovibrio sp.]MCW0235695.1 AMP-binding protein [Ferrovibrio sp.]